MVIIFIPKVRSLLIQWIVRLYPNTVDSEIAQLSHPSFPDLTESTQTDEYTQTNEYTQTRFSLSLVLSSTIAILSGDSRSVCSLLGWLDRPLSRRLECPLLPLRVRSLRSSEVWYSRLVFWSTSIFILCFLSIDTFESRAEISAGIWGDFISNPFFRL